jgi:tRNA (guanine37-N1)-methyltransferase
MNFYILTLFPEMIMNALNISIIGRAIENKKISIEAIDIRDFAGNKHGKVDDYPYGGGAGMVMQAAPVYEAYLSVKNKLIKEPRVIYLTPQGQVFNQTIARELSNEEDLILLCGHYEGVDERVLEMIVTDYISIGDYVLTGGELPAMVMVDTIARLVPGVLNNEESTQSESFSENLLEYPQYTRPEVFIDKKVPDVLLSGHHAKIEEWRKEQAIKRTVERRPDLMKNEE